MEVEIEDATPETDYSLLVFFGDHSVEFGTFASNDLGKFDARFRAPALSDSEIPLAELLPEGKDVRDITVVKILQDGSVILEGDF